METTSFQLIHSIFNKYDTDNNGKLELDELVSLLYDIGLCVKPEVAMKLLDLNDDGTITFDEFYNWWNQRDRFRYFKKEHLQELYECFEMFKYYDRGSKGYISYDDYRNVCRDIFQHPSKSHMALIDKNNDNKIQFNEFVDWISKAYPDDYLLVD